MKKFLSIAICAALALSTASCAAQPSKPASTPDKAASTAAPVEKVKIVFWDENAGPTFTPVYEKFIEKFEAENPDIDVEYVGIPWESAKQKYDVAIASGTTPDVAGTPFSWISDFYTKGALLPLDEYFDKLDGKADVPAGLVDSARQCAGDGKLYAIVKDTNLTAAWYRKDVFEKQGIKVPETWDEFFSAVEKGTDKANNVYGFSIRGGAGGANQLEAMMYAYSGITEFFDKDGKSTANDPKNVEFLTRFVNMYKTYTPESDITNGYKEMVAAFDSGFANMIIHNMGSYAEHKATLPEGSFGFLPMPKSAAGYRVGISGSENGYAIYANTKYPEQSWRFLSFLTAPEQISTWAETFGKIPPNQKVITEPWVNNTEHIKVAAEALADPTMKLIRTPTEMPGYTDAMNNVVGPALQEALAKKITPQQFADRWADAMNAAKAEYDAMTK